MRYKQVRFVRSAKLSVRQQLSKQLQEELVLQKRLEMHRANTAQLQQEITEKRALLTFQSMQSTGKAAIAKIFAKTRGIQPGYPN
eukprot:SAG31_NODE_37540_length_303_cov_1.000000_1_plen_84_part_01